MRDELAALQLERSFEGSLEALTPAQRWHYFLRVNRMAKIEAAPVAVANYIDSKAVPQPTDAELKAFFEKYKEQYPLPDSPEPGFREPQRIALEYFRADMEKFASPEMVTEEEIKEHYEKNKEVYDQLEKGPAATKPATETPSAEKPTPQKPSAEKPGTEKPVDEKPAANKPADEKPATEGEKKPIDEKAKEAPKEPDAAGEKAKEPAKEPEKSEKEKEPAKDSKDTSAVGRTSPFVLAAWMQDEPAKDEAKAKDAEAMKGPEPVAKEEKPAEQPAAPAAAQQPAAKPAESAKDEAKAAEPPQPAAKEATPADKAAPAPAATPEKPAEPKAGLSDTLKSRIRRQVAYEKIEATFKGLREQMDLYRGKWQKYDAERIRRQGKAGETKESKAALTPPPRPDFEKLAKEKGLTAGRTELVSQWQMRESEIGASMVGRQVPVWQYAYSTLGKFSPERSEDFRGEFLFWKTEDIKERIPKFDDEGVEKEVLRSWKLIKAREPALAAAKDLAAGASKDKESLKQALAEHPDLAVVTPLPFSWITFGNVPLGSAPNAARISNVIGVDMAGEEFMKTVFGLEPGQAGVAMNAPQTVAYVIRLVEFLPSLDDLWKGFEKDDFSKYAPAAEADRQKIVQAWLQEIKTSAGFEWTPEHKTGQAAESGPREREEEE